MWALPRPGLEPVSPALAGRLSTTAPPGKPHLYLFISFFLNFYLFIYYLWLCWVFVSVRGLSLVVASGGHSSSRCAGLSLSRPLLLWSTGSRRAGPVIVAHGPSCSAACGIFPDQGSNPCPLHWQEDSQPLRHQGSPHAHLLAAKEVVIFIWWPCTRLESGVLPLRMGPSTHSNYVHSLYIN